MTKKQKKVLVRIVVTVVITAIVVIMQHWVIEANRFIWFGIYIIPYAVIGYDILKKAFRGITKKQVFDENFLMAVATVGALAIGIYRTGDYLEAVAVMLFYQIGELFQSIAVGKSRKNISELMDIRPDYANVDTQGGPVKKDPDEVGVGTIIVVCPGEKVPIDGIVVEGTTSINTSALTGESIPRDVSVGDEIISGCINMSGVIKIRTTKEFGESTVSKILELVENAGQRKSKSENFIAKFARYYTPIVCYGALALAVLVPAVIWLVTRELTFGEWIYRALTFLVISCPCALVVSVPLSFFAGIGGAGNQGILVKGSNYLEALASVKVVVMDKTGTITKGEFEVCEIHSDRMAKDELVELAALVEANSSHPISRSILRAYGRTPDLSLVKNVNEISGHGIKALVDNREVAVGNDKLMSALGINCEKSDSVGTIVYVAVDNVCEGYILIADGIKTEAVEAIDRLKKIGVRKTVMLTGDMEAVADNVAKKVLVDEYRAELLPDDKVAAVEKLISEKLPKEKLAFVGDGINDAPVLTRADIGIAMGGIGSDAAIEAADVVIMDDNLIKLPKAIRIARKCMSIVYQNIWFALGIKAVCLILGALGIANMWLAIFADVGVMVIAVLNAIRALNVRKL